MELEKKYFEGLNADDDINLLAETDYINAENFRIGTTDKGSAMRLESIGGVVRQTVDDELIPAAGKFYTPIGATEDEERRRIIYFMYYDDGNHQIRCRDQVTNKNYKVMDQNHADLNFSKNSLVQAKVYGDLLIYTDDNQEIKVINIEAGIKTFDVTYVTDVKPYEFIYDDRLDYEDTTLLRRPPVFAPNVVKEEHIPYNPLNFVKEQAFQFTWRYFYRDYQYSVLGTWSKLINYNEEDTIPTNNWNRVRIVMSTFEKIPPTVQKVELIVKNMDTGSVQIIHTWDRDDNNQNTSLIEHNEGVAALAAVYYNDIAGINVSQAEQSKPEESIPRKCKALDTARKRLFIGNYLVGFNSPVKTSLALTLVDANLTTIIPVAAIHLWHISYLNIPMATADKHTTALMVYLPSISTPGWYQLPGFAVTSGTMWPSVGVPPTTIVFNTLLFAGATEDQAAGFNIPSGYDFVTFQEHNFSANMEVTGVLIGQHTNLFKTNSSVQLGVAFYDRLRRRIGMFTEYSKVVQIPDRSFTGTAFKSGIQWTLTNVPDMTGEIPKEAYFYGIVMTKNLRTRYFVQTFVDECRYAKKDALTGKVVVDPAADTSAGKHYVAIDIASLLKDGMGWQPSPGDMARIYPSGLADNTPVTLAVVGIEGRHLLCEWHNFGTFLAAHKMLVELWIPYKRSSDEVFFEIGEMYKITNPTLATRAYSAIIGTIRGDTHILPRESAATTPTSYNAEAMSINNKFWQTWWDDTGRAFPNVKNKEIRKPYSINFSNVYVIGTQVNGLSAFEILDFEDISPESGSIQKLLLTSKVQEDGTVMLVICYAETLTLYLGEAQISDASKTAFFAKSDGVIGSINALRGSYGTQNPESVILHRGQAYWFDALNGCFVRYDVNGLFPISDYKFRRVAKLIGETFLSLTPADIETLGGRPFIFGGIDPYHNEVLWAIPKIGTPPKKYLTDYPLTYYNAVGFVTITNIGNDGDKIEVFVFDPDYGKISLGFYVKQASDTTITILATSIKNVLAANFYGYTVTNAAGVITITARPGLGEVMNIGNRLQVQLTPVGGAVVTWNGLNPVCLQDGSGNNTGVKHFVTRERLVNGVADGYAEPNVAGADFVADETDTGLCPLPPPAATNFLSINPTDRVLINSVDKVII